MHPRQCKCHKFMEIFEKMYDVNLDRETRKIIDCYIIGFNNSDYELLIYYHRSTSKDYSISNYNDCLAVNNLHRKRLIHWKLFIKCKYLALKIFALC